MRKTNKLLLVLSLLLGTQLTAFSSGGIVVTTRDGLKLKCSLADIRKIMMPLAGNLTVAHCY